MRTVFFLFLIGVVMGCAQNSVITSPEETRKPAATKAQLPDHAQWDAIELASQNLDFTLPTVTLVGSSGGTSVYAVINVNKKPLGAVIPENSSTVLSGEIMTFNLARALGVADLYQPAFYHFLKGKNLARFEKLVDSMESTNEDRKTNKANILRRISKNPAGIPTVFKQFGTKPKEYEDLVVVKANTLSSSHKLPGGSATVAQLLQCSGPQPKDAKISIAGGQSTEVALVRQLSSIFLIDALTQEWDRFSGGNLQTLTEKGVVKFISFDNGGTWGGTKKTSDFLKLVTRFEPAVAQGILEMDAFFKSGPVFRGLTSETDFIQAMGIDYNPASMPAFKESLRMVADHIRKNAGCHFK